MGVVFFSCSREGGGAEDCYFERGGWDWFGGGYGRLFLWREGGRGLFFSGFFLVR